MAATKKLARATSRPATKSRQAMPTSVASASSSQAPERAEVTAKPKARPSAAAITRSNAHLHAHVDHWVDQRCKLSDREYGQLSILKDRACDLARPLKRSEILRVGLGVLSAMTDAQLFDAIDSVSFPKHPRKK